MIHELPTLVSTPRSRRKAFKLTATAVALGAVASMAFAEGIPDIVGRIDRKLSSLQQTINRIASTFAPSVLITPTLQVPPSGAASCNSTNAGANDVTLTISVADNIGTVIASSPQPITLAAGHAIGISATNLLPGSYYCRFNLSAGTSQLRANMIVANSSGTPLISIEAR